MVTLAEELNDTARRVFGWEALKPYQLEAITALLGGQDVLAVMSTGSGKSAIYEVPALTLDGSVLVISPLIALQQDQIAALEHSESPVAVAVNSRQGAADSDAAWAAIDNGCAGYVFLGPEQLANDEVLNRLARHTVALIAVDEAHCVCSWGHDFRPDYLRIPDAIDRLGRPPIVALTATASPILRGEITDRLRLHEPRVVVGSFDRPNIELAVHRHTDGAAQRAAVVDTVTELPGPGLLYCATRKDTEIFAALLVERGISALPYHAGQRAAQRDEVHRRFRDDEVAVVAATSAFGMGIDKPDVRFVVHASVPDSVDSYYQQIGRAGRDGEPSSAILFYRPEDLGLATFFASSNPDQDLLRRVYRTLSADRPKRLKRLREELGVHLRVLTRSANLLERAGVVVSDRRGLRTTGCDPDEAVRRAVGAARIGERIDRTRVEMLRSYAEAPGCRRQRLLAYFGDYLSAPCGNCDRCRAGDGVAARRPPAIPVQTRVDHREWGSGVVLEGDDERITVLFDEYGYRTLSMNTVREHDLLTVAERGV